MEYRAGTHRWRKGRLTDLSQTGFRLDGCSDCHIDTVIWVRIGGLSAMSAMVLWEDGAKVGCRLTKPLSPYVFDHLVATLKAMDASGG